MKEQFLSTLREMITKRERHPKPGKTEVEIELLKLLIIKVSQLEPLVIIFAAAL